MVIHGDARLASTYKTLLGPGGGGLCDVLITDPPYCLLERRRTGGDLRDPKARKRKLDDDPTVTRFENLAEYKAFTKEWLGAAIANGLKPGAPLIIWTNPLGKKPIMAVAESFGYRFVGEYLWAKRTDAGGSVPSMQSTRNEVLLRVYESALVLVKKDDSYKSMSNVPWSVITGYHDENEDAVTRRHPHPCHKPFGALEPLLRAWTKEGDTVLDVFAGSGAILSCAAKIGLRNFKGIEVLENWAKESNAAIFSASLPPPSSPITPLPQQSSSSTAATTTTTSAASGNEKDSSFLSSSSSSTTTTSSHEGEQEPRLREHAISFDAQIDALSTYCERLSEQEPPLLQQLREETQASYGVSARMISGHLQGRFLTLLTSISRAKSVLEFGTFTGYSSLCFAEGLAANAAASSSSSSSSSSSISSNRDEFKVFTCEIDGGAISIAKKYLAQSKFEAHVQTHQMRASELIAESRQNQRVFDMVFIDADKKQYKEYLVDILGQQNKEHQTCLLRDGALILVDNTLWKGLVLNHVEDLKAFAPNASEYGNELRMNNLAKSMHDFNSFVAGHPNLRPVLLPLRDGLSIIRYVASKTR